MMPSKCEREEQAKVRQEYEEAEKAERQRHKTLWNPARWNWRVLVLLTILSIVVRFVGRALADFYGW